jgi:PilZ domain
MTQGGQERRKRERMRLALPVRVAVREPHGEEWNEVTRILDLTPFGARFSLARPVDRGRLVYLTLPMPRPLRCFDHVEDQYRVWALVRQLQLTPLDAQTGLPRFELGVAFVGKYPPASYKANPATRYEIASQTPTEDLWRLSEQTLVPYTPVERETRLGLPVDVIVELLDERGQVVASEQTVTENISRHGASVFTTLTVESGRFIRVRSVRQALDVLAIVRGSNKGPDGIPRLHLEFLDREWPLELGT